MSDNTSAPPGKTIYVTATIAVDEEYFETASALLATLPITGMEEDYDALHVSFELSNFSMPALVQCIEQIKELGIEVVLVGTREISDQNWNAAYEQTIEPVKVNETITICPDWRLAEVSAPITIVINPQMSFGTGYHPTTRMMCRLVQKYLVGGQFWIDAGCGTGVLAILARKLGASGVFGFDNDEWAVANSKDNVIKNHCDQIEVIQADVKTVALPAADGICANMYRNLLIPNFTRLRDSLTKPGGVLLMSGILSLDDDEMSQVVASHGMVVEEIEHEGDWSAIVARFPGQS